MTRLLLTCLLALHIYVVFGNDVFVSGVLVTNWNTSAKTGAIQFTVEWQNSWRLASGPANWDAAWVFAKYRIEGTQTWRHASITGVNSAPNNCIIEVTQDGRGAFVYRATPGQGDILFEDIQLRWDYGSDNVPDNAVVELRVFATEMVYIPEGAFSLGSGGTEGGAFYQVSANTAARNPYRISSEAAISVGSGVGNLYYQVVSFSGDQGGPVPASYPKGFAAFYLMKYEVTQGEYVNFFNAQAQEQKINLDITDALGKGADTLASRNTIVWPSSGEMTTTSPNVPMAYMTAGRTWAYLDWVGLRPMSEMEFEKACRGPLTPVPDEYAWGGTSVHEGRYTRSNPDQITESVTNSATDIGNATYGATVPGTAGKTQGPLRSGIYAASAVIKNRESTGATYYGVMEMSGNLYELCVSAGDPVGRNFRRTSHGDGYLTEDGNANVAFWPSVSQGSGFHTGGFTNDAERMRVSYRVFSSYDSSTASFAVTGFRGARTKDPN